MLLRQNQNLMEFSADAGWLPESGRVGGEVSYRMEKSGACGNPVEKGRVLGLGRKCETARRPLPQKSRVAALLMCFAEPPHSLLLDRGLDSSLGTLHTDHSGVLARLERLNSQLFRSHCIPSRTMWLIFVVIFRGLSNPGSLGAKCGPLVSLLPSSPAESSCVEGLLTGQDVTARDCTDKRGVRAVEGEGGAL